MKTPSALPAVLADAAALLALFLLFPALSTRLSEPSGANALWLSIGFVLFCVGVYWLRRLTPAAGAGGEWGTRGARTALAVLFAVTVGLALAWQLGFFESGLQVDTRDLGEGGSAAYFVYAPGAWLGFSLLYVLALAFDVRSSADLSGGRRLSVATLGLLATNGMLLLLSAQARTVVGGGVWLLPAYLWLLVLFLPPRLAHLARELPFPSPAAYVALGLFLLVVGAYAIGIITA
jgi:hypothetical protein